MHFWSFFFNSFWSRVFCNHFSLWIVLDQVLWCKGTSKMFIYNCRMTGTAIGLLYVYTFFLLWAWRSSGILWDGSAQTGIRPVMVAASSKTMSQPLPSGAHELLAMSRPKLQSGCGTVNRPHSPYNWCLNSDSCSSWIADCAEMEKKIVCLLCIIVWHWHAKHRNLSCMLLHSKVLENVRVNRLIR